LHDLFGLRQTLCVLEQPIGIIVVKISIIAEAALHLIGKFFRVFLQNGRDPFREQRGNILQTKEVVIQIFRKMVFEIC
jgi:hypothetical protein